MTTPKTPQDARDIRFKTTVLAHQVILEAFVNQFLASVENGPELLRVIFQGWRKSHATIPLQGYPLEMANLMESEYREALDEILSVIKAKLPDKKL